MAKIELDLDKKQRYELLKQMSNSEIASYILENFDKNCLKTLLLDISDIKKVLIIEAYSNKSFYKDNLEDLIRIIKNASENNVKSVFETYTLNLQQIDYCM